MHFFGHTDDVDYIMSLRQRKHHPHDYYIRVTYTYDHADACVSIRKVHISFDQKRWKTYFNEWTDEIGIKPGGSRRIEGTYRHIPIAPQYFLEANELDDLSEKIASVYRMRVINALAKQGPEAIPEMDETEDEASLNELEKLL